MPEPGVGVYMPDGQDNRSRKEPIPSKLVRPRLHHAYPRQRLIRDLGEKLDHSAVWISAGPGYGKTVLASTYVEALKRPCMWYRVDIRDRDPATLFHYLRRGALSVTIQKPQSLPHLTPEYLAGIDTYARNFFERFFECFKPGSILVFDNCQELGGGSITTSLLAMGIAQTPESVRVVLTSREPPGPAFTRLLAGESLRLFDTAELALDADEARAIARQRFGKRITPKQADEIHRQARGWAAGFTLLLEQMHAQNRTPTPYAEHVFGYFTAEVLAHIDPDTLDTLLQGAWLSRMPVGLLSRQCESTQAAERIDKLCRRNYFISKTGGNEPVYEFHPLFRDCLLEHARTHWPAERLDAVRRRAAQLIIADGQGEDALDLLLEIGDWNGVAELIETHAGTWLAQGRMQIIESALAAMPENEIHARPWIIYWQASARLPFCPAAARTLFATALESFESGEDARGCYLAWSGVVDSFVYEWGDFTTLDRWIERFESLQKRYPDFPDPEAEVRAVTGIFTALSYRQPQHPDLPEWTQRTHRLIELNPDLRLLIGSRLVPYYIWWSGDLSRAASITALLQPQAERGDADPLTGVVWCAIRAMELWMISETQDCVAMAERGLELAERSGVHVWDFMLLAQAGWGYLTEGNLAAAETLLSRMSTVLDPARLLDACHYHYLVFTKAMHRGDVAAMHEHAETALQLARRAGVPWAQGIVLPALARALELRGDTPGANAAVAEAAALAEASHSGTIAYAALLARIELARARGKPRETLTALREFITLCRNHDFTNSSWWQSGIMADLCVLALEHDIETEFVRHLIRLRHLVPREPPLHLGNWPWPLDIVTLGRFEVRLNGEPLRFERKSQKRPLALLKALIALGGQNVPEARVADALWPDAEGDAAQQALATTLHRLRQLIGTEAVRRQDGILNLESTQCRVDLWSCERHLDQVEQTLNEDPEAAIAALWSALALYRGPFLYGDEDAPWALTPRERLRNHLLRSIVATADALQNSGHAAEAIGCYERGLELDELAEECYRGLMRCHFDSGHYAEGLKVYRRCTEALQRELGMTPSADTKSLYRALTAAE